ncbi:hypothetical protein B0H13DRAFT_1877271 [Mycena leptocephala]|nr:hypothetical protein B0H13DRAFT_1877271 [Mycena leptocephala]
MSEIPENFGSQHLNKALTTNTQPLETPRRFTTFRKDLWRRWRTFGTSIDPDCRLSTTTLRHSAALRSAHARNATLLLGTQNQSACSQERGDVTIGGVMPVLLGVTAIFCGCKRFKRRRRADTEAELAAGVRSAMLPTPPSSFSATGLLGRLRGGRAFTSSPRTRVAPGEFRGAADSSSPRSPNPPGSLLNPRVNLDAQVAEQPLPPSPANEDPPRRDPGWVQDGLFRPGLAVMQQQSSRTLEDHVDYSRPIHGHVNMRMESENTVHVESGGDDD